MSLPTLEELAEKWTFAHTIAVVAWAAVMVLGILLLLQNTRSTYPAETRVKVYAAENATFKLPINWKVNSDCDPNRPFIELPGTIESDYKKKGYELQIYGMGAFSCVKNRPERLDIYPEQMVASDNPCAPATSTEGKRLGNGLYLNLKEQGGKIVAVHIQQNVCYAPANTVVLGFSFVDPKAETDDMARLGPPRVKKEDFLKSPQYRDIKALAESIRY